MYAAKNCHFSQLQLQQVCISVYLAVLKCEEQALVVAQVLSTSKMDRGHVHFKSSTVSQWLRPLRAEKKPPSVLSLCFPSCSSPTSSAILCRVSNISEKSGL